MIGIEDRVYVKVEDYEPVYAIADEDLDRETEEKTSSVHFLRFELDRNMVAALRNGAALEHEHRPSRLSGSDDAGARSACVIPWLTISIRT